MSPSYVITRTGLESWTIDGTPAPTLDDAMVACEAADEARGYTWDFPTHGDCKDGLEALRVGESMTVTPPVEEDDEDDLVEDDGEDDHDPEERAQGEIRAEVSRRCGGLTSSEMREMED